MTNETHLFCRNRKKVGKKPNYAKIVESPLLEVGINVTVMKVLYKLEHIRLTSKCNKFRQITSLYYHEFLSGQVGKY